ncbi:MAG: hypothetical protein RLZZ178_1598 [Verrucomicrobiota bacterium]
MRRPLQLALLLGLNVALAVQAEKIQFNRDIRPILSENCFSCHGSDEKARKAKLRLDLSEEAKREHKNGTPVVPGDLTKSVIWERILSTDEDEVMPPPKSHLALTATDKSKIKAWIEQGAEYEEHWAFVAPKRTALPVGNKLPAVDYWVSRQLAEAGLRPSPEADRHTLIRRVTLDLTGLPPSAAEVEAFVQDRQPDAYGRLVDRLLASPHFGERMGLDWLDAARYSDTNGYSIDGGRHLWLWRDWVIQTFNDNKPYDRFLAEQIAGDLMPDTDDGKLIATGFQRNNMNTHEGGTIPAENLVNYNADRVKTLGESVLGLTLACAQCHDHKFDPISQKDYFRIFAYFNTLDDRPTDGNAGVNSLPSALRKTVLKTDELPALRERITALERRLQEPDPKVLALWERTQKKQEADRKLGLKLIPVNLLKVSTPNSGGGFSAEGNKFRGITKAAYDILGETPQAEEPIAGLRFVFPDTLAAPKPTKAAKAAKSSPAAPKPMDALAGRFVLTAVDVTADRIAGDQVNIHRLLKFSRITADAWTEDYPAKDVRAFDVLNRGWSPPAATGTHHLTLTFATPITAKDQPYLTTQIYFGNKLGGAPSEGELFAFTGHDDGTDLPESVLRILATNPAERTAGQRQALWAYCANHSDEMAAARTDLANARERLRVLTEPQSTMVMNLSAKPRETFILNRGDYSQPTVKVEAGTPAKLPALPAGAPANRLGLAEWLIMKENPLTARVAVNRVWKLLFGAGIVTTAADFGFQGEWPSHPELLDTLAVDFVDSGWDLKGLIRQIVTSSTYRQTSRTSAELLEKDPANRLLSRGPRFRLQAELIRDQALQLGGLIVPQLGGPSVNPYSPFDLWREVSHYGSSPATSQVFVQDHGEKLYRRSMYTYWKRTAPPANMVTFDAPNREVCTISRSNTTTPLQALVTLNDVQFVEAARGFAQRIIRHGDDDSARIRWAFLEAVSRPPSAKELALVGKALARERTRYAADHGRALKVLSPGESTRDETIPATEHAAWMQIATLLLNLSETVTRN